MSTQFLTNNHSSRSRRSELVSAIMFLSLTASASALAASLPDTGQTQCDNGFNQLVACDGFNSGDTALYPRQDGRFGRDARAGFATPVKRGAGAAGFDYTKVANNGAELGSNASLGPFPTDWGCTKDNITGLTWEMKNTTFGDLHDWGATFSWYSTDNASNGNGGTPGRTGPGTGTEIPSNEDGNTCHFLGTLVARCNTEAFITSVNNAGLCGYHDGWRLPTQRELLSLVNAGGSVFEPAIDKDFFPNTVPPILGGIYWSSATYLLPPYELTYGWGVDFADGNSNISPKEIDHLIRLVRGVPF